MITRAQMPRQLRNRGGMTVKTVRQKYGLGSLVKKTIRKLIPNELADIAVKAAPFVAPFNPGAAALMRGVGRFDQRGSVSDALKQGAATYAFGKVAGKLGGAESGEGFFGGQTFSKQGFSEGPIGSMFPKTTTTDVTTLPKPKPVVPEKETGIIRAITDKTIAKIPGATKLLPKSVMDQLVVGGITSGASALYSYFKGDFRPQEEGETMEEYLAARKVSVGKQMRTFMDNYYRFDSEYSAMSDAERDAFVARYNMNQGGIVRLGYQTGNLVDPRMRQSISRNIAENKVNREINRAMRKPSGLRELYQKYGFQTPQIQTRFAPSMSRNPMMELQNRQNLVEDIIARQVQSANPPQMGNQFVGGPDSLSQQMAERDRIIAENQRIFREYMDQQMGTAGSIPSIGMGKTLSGPVGPGTTPPEKDQSLISRLTKLTPLQATSFDPFDQLSDRDQYNLALAYPELQKQLRDSSFVPGGNFMAPTDFQLFQRRFGIKKGGIMDVPVRTNSEGIKELDYRKTGGFVPIGVKEKADDVPAMLSKNEFVFTADAVRGAGNGSIKKGAQRMYDTMKKLESRVG